MFGMRGGRLAMWWGSVLLILILVRSIQAAADGRATAPVGAPNVAAANALPNSTFSSPVDIAHAGDNRLFVVQQGGIIRVTPLDPASPSATTFLNISDRVTAGGERGLLGLAFHPNYAENGYFYVNYTHTDGQLVTRVSRFEVTADPNVADPDSERVIIQIPQVNTPYNSNHNGGDLNFGPDGQLYIGMGDGGGSGDQDNNAQNMGQLLGKMLRINVDGVGLSPDCVGGNYAVPADNPFVGQPGSCNEIWAAGLRNPWRFSFDRVTGDLFIGDVGQGSWEEVDFQPAASPGGENYGWRCYEGNHAYNLQDCQPATAYVFPIDEYSHAVGCSITGGFVYRGQRFPSLQGRYIYGDYCSGNIWSLTPSGGGWAKDLLLDMGAITTFGEDACGELYFTQGSDVYRLLDEDAADAPSLCLTKSGPATAASEHPFTYAIQVSNTGNAAAANLVITDTLPVGVTYIGGGAASNGLVTWNLATLPAYASVSLTLTVAAGSSVTNADYGLTADGGYRAQGRHAVTTAIAGPALAIVKEGPATASAGQPVTYTLTVHNSGDTSATNLVITDTLPAGATYLSGGSLTGDEVLWLASELAPGAHQAFQFAVTGVDDLLNLAYGVRASNHATVLGAVPVLTLVDPVRSYLPLITGASSRR